MKEEKRDMIFDEFAGTSKAKDLTDPVPTEDDAILEEMAAFAETKDPEFAARFRALFREESHITKHLLSRSPGKILWYMVIDEDDAKALSPEQPVDWDGTFGYMQEIFPQYAERMEEEILEMFSNVLSDISEEYVSGICDEK